MKIKIDKDKLMKASRLVITFAGGVLLDILENKARKTLCVNDNNGIFKATLAGTYSDAISAITNSSMSSYYKQEAIKMLRKDGDVEYYRSVISIALDDKMGNYYKYESIKNLK